MSHIVELILKSAPFHTQVELLNSICEDYLRNPNEKNKGALEGMVMLLTTCFIEQRPEFKEKEAILRKAYSAAQVEMEQMDIEKNKQSEVVTSQ